MKSNGSLSLWMLSECSLKACLMLSESSWSHPEVIMNSSWRIWTQMMKIVSSRQDMNRQTNKWMKICISWAPVGAKNFFSLLDDYMALFRILSIIWPWRLSNSCYIKQFKIQTTIAQTLRLVQWTGIETLLWLFTEEQGNQGKKQIENLPNTIFSWCYINKCQNNIYSEHSPTKISENAFVLSIKKFFPFN